MCSGVRLGSQVMLEEKVVRFVVGSMYVLVRRRV